MINKIDHIINYITLYELIITVFQLIYDSVVNESSDNKKVILGGLIFNIYI